MNIFTFDGHLGRDAELKHTQSGKVLCKFSVPASAGWGENKKTTWINCTVWGSRAESLCQYLLKGTKVIVSGEFEIREYQKNDMSMGYSADLNVNDIVMASGQQQQQNNYYPTAQVGSPAPTQPYTQDYEQPDNLHQYPQQQQQQHDQGTNGYQQPSGQNYRNKPSGKSSVYQNQQNAERQARQPIQASNAAPADIDFDDIPF